MPSIGTKKRIARIRKRATPEVQRAFEQGRISARRADVLLYLPQEEQRRELAHILAAQQDAKRRSQVAAEVIKAHLAAGKRDLTLLQKDLQLARCSPPTIPTHA
jgi:hypothetical protein